MNAAAVASRLRGRRAGGGYVCRCPAHEDKNPSLSLKDADDGRILVHCHAGCRQEAVIEALKDLGLWPDENRERTRAIVAE